MNQLTHEEEAKVFATHLPCMVLCGMQIGWRLSQKTYPANLHFYVENRHRNLKLLLTPLKEITDEHAIEVCKMGGKWEPDCEVYKIARESFSNGSMQVHIKTRRKYRTDESAFNADGYCYFSYWFQSFSKVFSYEQIQYLISKGYAVPLWFGIDHWANGMTAIELKIAISYSEYQYTLLAKQLLHQKPAINLKS